MQEIFPRTINDILKYRAEKTPERIGFWVKDGKSWQPLYWREYIKSVELLARGLHSLGIAKGDRAVIISGTRYEWELAEKALLLRGAIVAGVNISASPQEIEHTLQILKVNVLIVENEVLLKKTSQLSLSNLKTIIVFEKTKKPYVFLKELLDSNAACDMQLRPVNINPDDPAFIMHTSGATGEPKMVIYKHRHIVSACMAIADSKLMKGIGPDDATISWLPLPYMTGRIMGLCAVYLGVQVYYINDARNLSDEFKDIGPTIFIAVPRFFEKVYSKIKKELDRRRGFMRSFLNSLILRRARYLFGRRLKFMISGSASISPRILEFLYSAGILVLEGYAITENAIPMAMNRPDKFRFGTVGVPLAENEIVFAKDGEILVKGKGVFEGYLGEEQDERNEAFNEQGYFKTGDLGYLDKDGFLVLTGRKKEIIKTSTGLRISPLEIENIYKAIPYIEHIIVVGNQHKYLTALLTLSKEAISSADMTDVEGLIEKCIAEKHGKLAKFKRIAKFTILPGSFSVESGELTASLKIRRLFVESKYRDEIERMYSK